MADEEDLVALRDGARRVLADACQSPSLHAFWDGASGLERSLWKTAAELGWLAAGLPEDDGGLGLGLPALNVLHQEFGRHVAPGPFIASLAAGQWLAQVLPPEKRVDFLPALAAGEISLGAPAVLDGSETLAVRGSALSGRVRVLGWSDCALAIVPVGAGGRIESWALIQPQDVATLTPIDNWDRSRSVCQLDCRAAAPLALIPDPSGALSRGLLRQLVLAVAADSVGAAQGVAEKTVEYMKTRVQFEKPIGSFQALKHRAADLHIKIASNERLLAQAVNTAAAEHPDADLWAALAKAGATEAAAFVAGDCVQLHGGIGHTWSYDCHMFLKRARFNEALLCNNRRLRDLAAEDLAEAVRSGRSPLELPE